MINLFTLNQLPGVRPILSFSGVNYMYEYITTQNWILRNTKKYIKISEVNRNNTTQLV